MACTTSESSLSDFKFPTSCPSLSSCSIVNQLCSDILRFTNRRSYNRVWVIGVRLKRGKVKSPRFSGEFELTEFESAEIKWLKKKQNRVKTKTKKNMILFELAGSSSWQGYFVKDKTSALHALMPWNCSPFFRWTIQVNLTVVYQVIVNSLKEVSR